MKPRARVLLAAAVVLSQAAGCSDGGEDGPSNGTPMESGPNAPTFAELYMNVLAPQCAAPFCHGTAVGGNLVMANAALAHQSLVDQLAQGMVTGATGVMCADTGLKRVVPGQPEMSLLYMKLMDPPPCGDRMPIAVLLPAEQIEQIRLWIEAGALNN